MTHNMTILIPTIGKVVSTIICNVPGISNTLALSRCLVQFRQSALSEARDKDAWLGSHLAQTPVRIVT